MPPSLHASLQTLTILKMNDNEQINLFVCPTKRQTETTTEKKKLKPLIGKLTHLKSGKKASVHLLQLKAIKKHAYEEARELTFQVLVSEEYSLEVQEC